MKQIAQNYKSGEVSLEDVPAPACKGGGVLVRTRFSLISTGTEMMKVRESKMSLVGKARARPDQVKKVMESVAQQGVVATGRKVMNRLDSLTPLGYSLVGEVVEVGAGVDAFRVGQRVACGGDKYAHHAEFNWVPKNLCVPVPDSVPDEQAAFTTVGAIAMQGFRQSEAKLGESACVVGLGLIGQILVQILRAAGVSVVGVDISAERCTQAQRLGAAAAAAPDKGGLNSLRAAIDGLTNGAGVDYVFLTAGGNTNQPVELAADLARDRARVIDIGKCKLDLPWKDYYGKELDIRFSRSYGPGRYDPIYEEGGIDYPVGYVRWTERRNMACFLDLIADGRLDLTPLISDVFDFHDAVGVYERVNKGEIGGLGILYRYRDDAVLERRVARPRAAAKPAGNLVRLGFIGSGNYATSMLLPHLKGRGDVALVEVATATALSAANAQRKFGFERTSTDYRSLLADEDIDAVMIVTRHSAHAAMVCDALGAGKAVFVEKPLAVTPEQLDAIRDAIEESGNDRLMVGFNRRFAPMLVGMRDSWGRTAGPLTVHYRVNAGQLDAESWYGQTGSEGSRFIGEGCHFVDTVSWWLGADPVEAWATRTTDDPDNVVAVLRYPDGSVGQISYLTLGDNKYPKEAMEVFGERKTARMHNFQRTEVWQGGSADTRRARLGIDKGQKAEVGAFVEAVKSGGPMPIALASLFATTETTFAVMRSAASGVAETVGAAPTKADDAAAEPLARPAE